MIFNFVLAPIQIILPVLVKEGIGLPPWYLGALESTQSLGLVVGAWSPHKKNNTGQENGWRKYPHGNCFSADAFLPTHGSPVIHDFSVWNGQYNI